MLNAYWTLQEDSGDALDATGNGNAGTVTGATQGATGILGTTAYSFDGTDDEVEIPHSPTIDHGGTDDRHTFTGFGTVDGTGDFPMVWLQKTDDNDDYNWPYFLEVESDGTYNIWTDQFTTEIRSASGVIPTDGTWFAWAIRYNVDTIKGYINGEEVLSGTINNQDDSNQRPLYFGIRHGDSGGIKSPYKGKLSNIRFYDHLLSKSEIEYLHNVIQSGEFLTETYTHGSNIQPDLRAAVTLNGMNATAYVIGSPGTSSEEVVAQTLSDGTNDYSLSWSSGHTDFRIQVRGDLTDPPDRVESSKVALLV
jgi:hypothetical protein